MQSVERCRACVLPLSVVRLICSHAGRSHKIDAHDTTQHMPWITGKGWGAHQKVRRPLTAPRSPWVRWMQTNSPFCPHRTGVHSLTRHVTLSAIKSLKKSELVALGGAHLLVCQTRSISKQLLEPGHTTRGLRVIR